MTLTLKNGIDATQTTIDVNGADTLRVGSYRQLEDEVLLIRHADPRTLQPGETAWQRLTVDRGIENSEPVAHDAGVTMAAYSGGGGGGAIAVTDGVTTVAAATSIEVTGGTVTDEGGGVAGVAVQTRILGPFTVNYNTANLETTGVSLAEVSAGTVVFATWAAVTTTFAGGGVTSAVATVFLGGKPEIQAPGEAWSDGYYVDVARLNVAGGNGKLGISPDPVVASTSLNDQDGGASIKLVAPCVALEDCVVGISLTRNGTGLTAGVASVYVMVAETP